MKISTQEQMSEVSKTFNQPKVDKKLYRLVQAVYHDRTEEALDLIKNDPDQINRQDPYSGLTPLNIAVFRQNQYIVRALIEHPAIDIHLKDKFGRTAFNMLDYNANPKIFVKVFNAFKPDDEEELRQMYVEDGGLDEYYAELKEMEIPDFVPEKPKEP